VQKDRNYGKRKFFRGGYYECQFRDHRVNGRLCRHSDCFGICGKMHKTMALARKHCAVLNREGQV
jgi:hypothetical protein